MLEATDYKNLLVFLSRVDLKGGEAHTLVMLQMKLNGTLKELEGAQEPAPPTDEE